MKNYLFIFDMGGVLAMNVSLWKDVGKALGLQDPIKEGPQYLGLLDAASRGNITSMEDLCLIAERAHLPRPAENYWKTFFHPILHQPTLNLIAALKKAGQRVVCGTNTIDVHYQCHIHNGDYNCFDKVYASNIMGQIKPDITFWHAIKNAEKTYRFDDMFFFDDNPDNTAAAASLGIHAHVFTTAEDTAAYINAECGTDVVSLADIRQTV